MTTEARRPRVLLVEDDPELVTLLARLLAGYDRLFGFSLPYVMGIRSAPTRSAAPKTPRNTAKFSETARTPS